MDNRNLVVLVDDLDNPIGTMEKLQAHEEGRLHRAFSVLIFNTNRELLIHRRAMGKYHSGGLWTNTCCSHPMPDESNIEAAHRRLQEEMGFDCPLIPAFSFQYEAKLDRGLTEKEFDHVFFGIYNGPVEPNPNEVMDCRHIGIEELRQEMSQHPDNFTEWFKIILGEIDPYLEKFQPSRQAVSSSNASSSVA